MNFFALIQMLPLLFLSAADAQGSEKHNEPESSAPELADPVATEESAAQAREESASPPGQLYIIPDDVPSDIEKLLIKYSAKYGLPLDVVVRLSEVESNHGEFVRSVHTNFDGSIDIGVLALNSNFIEYYANRYFEGVAEDFDPYNPEHNIQTGLAYLAHLNHLTGGDINSAVTAYNCGYRSMLSGDIPYSTRRYVRAIVHGESL